MIPYKAKLIDPIMDETARSEAQTFTLPCGLPVHVLQKGAGNPAAQDKITSVWGGKGAFQAQLMVINWTPTMRLLQNTFKVEPDTVAKGHRYVYVMKVLFRLYLFGEHWRAGEFSFTYGGLTFFPPG